MAVPTIFDEARAWLADCPWSNVDGEDLQDLTDAEAKAAVERYYEGAWPAFERACRGLA